MITIGIILSLVLLYVIISFWVVNQFDLPIWATILFGGPLWWVLVALLWVLKDDQDDDYRLTER